MSKTTTHSFLDNWSTDFEQFDFNEACEHWDYDDPKHWQQVNQFIVVDGEEQGEAMREHFDYDDDSIRSEYLAFGDGARWAMARLNMAFEAAGLDLRVKECDLGGSSGFVLTLEDQTPEQWAQAVFSKRARKFS